MSRSADPGEPGVQVRSQRLAAVVDSSAPASEHARGGLVAHAQRETARRQKFAAELRAYMGRQTLRPTTVDLRPLLGLLADELRIELDARIDVGVDVERNCPSCRVDAARLREALMRLVLNACDAMPNGGVLLLRGHPVHPAEFSGFVAVSVTDSGAGMAQGFSRRAALPFVSTKDEPMAGMGLAAVSGFVRQSGGFMSLSCSPGAGLTVTLRLPRPDDPRPRAGVAWKAVSRPS